MARRKIEENYDETRQRFIYAAIDELMDSGYSGFTLTNVARRTGVTKAALYWYFPSKEKLIEEVADTVYSFYVKKAEAIIASSADPLEKLRAIFASHQDLKDDKICMLPVKIFMELLSVTSGLKQKIQQGYEEYMGCIVKVIEEGMGTGVFQSRWSAKDLAEYIVSTFDGFAMLCLIVGRDEGDSYQTRFEMTLAALIK